MKASRLWRASSSAVLSVVLALGMVPSAYADSVEGSSQQAGDEVREEAINAVPDSLGEIVLESMEDEGTIDFSDVELEPGTYVEDEVLVIFADGVDTEDALVTMDALDVEDPEECVSEEVMESGDVVCVPLADDVSVEDALQKLNEDPNVIYAQPNYTYYLYDEMPTQYFIEQDDGSLIEISAEELEAAQALQNQGETALEPQDGSSIAHIPNDPWASDGNGTALWQYSLANCNVYAAWDTVRLNSDEQVRIAVLDTGVNAGHREFQPDGDVVLLANDLAFDSTKGTATAVDTFGHGTHVTGIIAAHADNGYAIAGNTYNGQVVPFKVFPDGSNSTSTFYIADGLQRAIATEGVRVINMSLGGPAYSDSEDALMHAAIIDATNKNIVIVCASGNENTDSANYPGDYDEVISVNATDANNAKADYSNYGPLKDISAPGTDIISTYIDVDGYAAGNVLARASGTSMASPFVAGVCALVIEKTPEITVDQLKRVLYNTATDLGEPGFDNYYANGLINAELAVLQDPTIELDSPSSCVGQTAYMQFNVLNDDNNNYTWSFTPLDDTPSNAATITQDGLLRGIYTGRIRVRATLKSDPSRYAEKNITIMPLALSSPPRAESMSSSSVLVSWDAADGALGYKVFRYTSVNDTDTSSPIAVVDGETFSVLDEGLTCGDLLYYRVLPTTEFDGEPFDGTLSSAVSVRVAPARPRNLAVGRDTETSLKVTWDAVDQADGYYLYRRAQDYDSDFTLIADVLQPDTSTVTYTDEDLTEGAYYEYKVVAYKLYGYREITSEESDTAVGVPRPDGWIERARAPLDFIERIPTSTYSTIDLSWSPEEGADGYLLTVDELEYTAEDPIIIPGSNTSQYRLRGLQAGWSYTCHLRSYNLVDGVDDPDGLDDLLISSDQATVYGATMARAPENVLFSQSRNGTTTIELSWDPDGTTNANQRMVVEQRGRAYSNSDGVLTYRGQWIGNDLLAYDSDGSATVRLASDAPTLVYGLCEFRVCYAIAVSAVDRTGRTVDLAQEQKTFYGQYTDPTQGVGSLATPQLSNAVVNDDGGVTLTFITAHRCQRYVIYRSTSRAGTFERIASLENPHFTEAESQLYYRYYTDHPQTSGTYWYYVVGETDVNDGVWTSEKSSYKNVRVTLPEPPDISGATISAIPPQAFTGTEVRPKPTVTYEGTVLNEGVDYELSYADNIVPGTATATITGIGAYRGTVTTQFTIKRDSSDDSIWTRIAGDNRYATMEMVAASAFEPGSCDTVVLAGGETFPDALAASALAAVYGSPVVLTASGPLSAEAASTIDRLEAENVVIVGGPDRVSNQAVQQLQAMGLQVRRIAGASRYETACLIAAEVADQAPTDTVIVAVGNNFPDALSIGPYAYASKTPILLAGNDGLLDDATLDVARAMGAENVILVGGTNVVSDRVATQIGGGCKMIRLCGDNRYETSAAIAQWACGQDRSASIQPEVVLSFAYVGVSSGSNFPDALAGAAALGSKRGVLLLVDDSAAGRFNVDYTVRNNRDSLAFGYVYGGDNRVAEAVMERLNEVSA